MSKIWFFGDSYAAPKNTEKSWTVNVQEAFPEYDNENLAVIGSSLDYLYHTYEQSRNRFESGDIVIMSLTVISRLFLRNTTPSGHLRFLLGQRLLATSGAKEILDENHEYYGHFVSDLFNPKAHTSTLNLFLNSLRYDAMTKGIKIVALPITYYSLETDIEDKDTITIAKATPDYNLINITTMVYNKKFNVKRWQDHTKAVIYDSTAANHLTPENNEILANKVIRHLKTNEPIDLATEWVEI